LERRSPPFAQNAKDGAPSSSLGRLRNREKLERTAKAPGRDSRTTRPRPLTQSSRRKEHREHREERGRKSRSLTRRERGFGMTVKANGGARD